MSFETSLSLLWSIDLINSINSGDVANQTITAATPDNFTSQEGKNMIESHAENIEEIKQLDTEIADLQNQKSQTDNPKEQAKIDKW